MSFSAIRWAFAQPVEKSSAKFLLVAMADCVNGDEEGEMLCWPSAKHLMEITGQDIKTVESGIKRLRDSGFIKPNGELRGRTGQVIVYRLTTPEIGGVTEEKAPAKQGASEPVEAPNTPVFGGCGEVGNTPKFPGNTPKFPIKDPQISHETPPKTGDGTYKEPIRNLEGTNKRVRGFDPMICPLPDWLDREVWGMWCKDRKDRKKPITQQAAALQIKTLDELRAKGWTPRQVIENAISNGWQGLYPPNKSSKVTTAKQSRHSGFGERDYEEGITDGTPSA